MRRLIERLDSHEARAVWGRWRVVRNPIAYLCWWVLWRG